jgi:predicted lipid-binding transport protein (Tim44 family)
MEQRFHALRTIGSIFRVVGYIILVLTVLGALAFCGATVIGASAIESSVAHQLGVSSTGGGFLGGLFGGLIGGFFVLLYGGFISLSIIATGELIYLLIGVEENTRKTNFMIENQMNRMSPPTSSAMTPKEPPAMTPSQPPAIPPSS